MWLNKNYNSVAPNLFWGLPVLKKVWV